MANAVNVFHETSEFTCMFPNLIETEKFQDQDTGMYSITMCFGIESQDQVQAKSSKPCGRRYESRLCAQWIHMSCTHCLSPVHRWN